MKGKLNTLEVPNIFRNTTASYKYLWFLSMLEEVNSLDDEYFYFWELSSDMIAKAWRPILVEGLSFGKLDSMKRVILNMQVLLNLPDDAEENVVRDTIREHREQKEVKKLLDDIVQSVPFRFLSPWIEEPDNQAMIERSQKYENGCPYSIEYNNRDEIIVCPSERWKEYIRQQYNVLRGFTIYSFTEWLIHKNE